MKFLIGVGLIILGGVSCAVTGFMPLAIIMFVGVFLFASFNDEALFCDYIIANSSEALIRKRYYVHFIPFTLISIALTFGKAPLKIVWKEEYFKASLASQKEPDMTRLSRKAYIALRNEQRVIYSTQPLSREFMEQAYTLEEISFQRKKKRLNIAGFFAALMLTMIILPGGIGLTLIYEAVFVPMVLLWLPEYKDAKILHRAYQRAMTAHSQT